MQTLTTPFLTVFFYYTMKSHLMPYFYFYALYDKIVEKY
ncbi:hypothetical protein SPJ1_1204 [Streptococcus parauberis KRS-02083]|uniref:Uncharacterized protein n=1 Tax=Streptococcus parauberis KRS-02083 TaxID=1207545 RepID=A0ABN0ISN2_9STRE|nr:hypothetical protein SPJ1_1204 [Streptococcus parauberis KRS-02083]